MVFELAHNSKQGIQVGAHSEDNIWGKNVKEVRELTKHIPKEMMSRRREEPKQVCKVETSKRPVWWSKGTPIQNEVNEGTEMM